MMWKIGPNYSPDPHGSAEAVSFIGAAKVRLRAEGYRAKLGVVASLQKQHPLSQVLCHGSAQGDNAEPFPRP